jgi:F-type H+-transporting ATPase subunit b
MQPLLYYRVVAAALGLVTLWAGQASAAAEGGLELFPDWRFQLPLLVALFAVLIPIVNRVLLRPLLRVLDARAERTEGARRRASRLAEQARELVARYERALFEARQAAERSRRAMLDEARRRAAEETSAARSDAEREIARARQELAAASAQARRGLRAQSEELAREAASRVLGRSVA